MQALDHNEAKSVIAEWIDFIHSESNSFVEDGLTMPMEWFKTTNTTVVLKDTGDAFKLMRTNGTELVLTVVGVLGPFNLPPVKKNLCKATSVPYLQQDALVYGYDTTSVVESRRIALDIFLLFATTHGTSDMQPCQLAPVHESFGHGMKAETKYFSLGRKWAPFRTEMHRREDAQLAALQNETVHHCDDNRVEYFEWKDADYAAKDPATFKEGDIVQMGVAFVGFKGFGPNPGKIKICLRSLALLDKRFSTAVARAKILQQTTPIPQVVVSSNPFARKRKAMMTQAEEGELAEGVRKRLTLGDAPARIG